MPKVGKSDKNLVKRSTGAIAESIVFATAEALAETTPFIAPAWALSKALFGNAMQLRQQRVFEFVESIIDDPKAFNESLTGSEEFKDGFVVALEDYMKIRNHLKRRVARKVFREFAVSDNKVEFQLERFNDTLLKISSASIQTLAFIKETILPLREQGIRSDLATQNMGISQPYKFWYAGKLQTESVSKYFDKWIYDRYNPNSDKLKNEHNGGESIVDEKLLMKLFDIERDVSAKMKSPLAELEYLGLIKWVSDPASIGWSGGGGATAWKLTDFAYEFIEFIEDAPEDLGENIFTAQQTPKS